MSTAEDPSIVPKPERVRHYGPRWTPLPAGRGTVGSRVILVGVDGSTTSLRAATYACGLARRERCRLVVVHVISAGAWAWAMPGGGAVLQRIAEELDAELQTEIRRMAEDAGVPVSVVSRLGHPSYCLPSIADEIQADVVVVGASSQMHSRLGGSLATRLIRLNRWPVTVVP
jgi:nucleotide-binding universal stress UspA family protein